MTALGSLEGALRKYPEGQKLLLSAGAVSDAFIMSNGVRDLLNGPVGSGKTTACVKRALRSAIEQPPLLATGRRLYSLVVYRETYAQLWGTTIKSWLKVLDPQKGVGNFTGSAPRPALHVIDFEDAYGPIRMEVNFQAFGEDADPDDLGGSEYTDAYLNEMNTLRQDLAINIARSVGRYPNRGEIGFTLPNGRVASLNDPALEHLTHGRIFGDCNAPSPLEWVYADYFSPKKPAGNLLFRQPGGRDPRAENLTAVGRRYYAQMVESNGHRPWWIRIKIDNEPGFNRDTDVVYPDYVDSRMASAEPLTVFPEIPVIVGFDGGNTPAAVLLQPVGGQLRLLAEVALPRGDELDLARELTEIVGSPRFRGCEFYLTGDPATFAGDETTGGSWAQRLGRALGLDAHEPNVANTDTEGRHYPIREAMKRVLPGDRPGFVLDGVHCPTVRRGLNGTFHYHTTRGTSDRGKVVKTPDSHAVEAAEYGACMTGSGVAMKRKSDRQHARAEKRAEGRRAGAYNPLRRTA